ncbi:MAG TPA: RNA polymerase sigma factor [Bacteroidales bacterium]|mgnify:CR=1 FL=1|nr:RNA polymerase sigma factor [Bacteroidales bacterium]HPS17593.1 RNA polymerase sigma factor [Bacteroidales bacterium]
MNINTEIIEACKKNERSAQKFVYEKFFSRFYAVCVRYIKDREEALEVLNDGFINMFKNIEQYKCDGSFEGWARRIIVNKAIDYIRSNKKYKEVFKYIDDYKDVPVKIEIEEDMFDINELYDMVHNLPNIYRMVFNLYAIDGFSHKEIAERIGVSEGTSRWYLSESRKMLKEKLTLVSIMI